MNAHTIDSLLERRQTRRIGPPGSADRARQRLALSQALAEQFPGESGIRAPASVKA